jgi:hypothetical protein
MIKLKHALKFVTNFKHAREFLVAERYFFQKCWPNTESEVRRKANEILHLAKAVAWNVMYCLLPSSLHCVVSLQIVFELTNG